ncbi:phage tail sheath subtilisin-like domain-containing protein [Methanobacterium formicicum]|uniref:Phage tail sheath subtilisin-like domain-containing protein n=1 Tax=Methanobacterium formicicum TaxID=2162 RepID=A0A843AG39_METFO|nr:phage tail sheath subtilisin-like domain-containing protein [Methanobacterium formicicum]MBF4474532.1 phage tail sheath subtilisin-like domain-containing protein [Methanobacterium formicicum]
MNIDTTIPGRSAEFVDPDVSVALGSAGIIAVVGLFEKGDENTPYFARNANEALDLMGKDPAYPGSKIIPQIFKPDPENNNYGATSAILINAGTRAKASCILVDTTTPDPVTVMTLKVKGGTWGNDLTVTIASGSIAGKKVTIMNGTEILETWDNLADATAVYNKLKSHSSIIEEITAGDLTKTLKDVAASPFSGGSETAEPSTSDLSEALVEIQDESFDILIFTDLLDESYIPSVEQYLQDRFEADNASGTILAMDKDNTVSQARTLTLANDSVFILGLVYQTFIIGNTELNEAETAARYAGYVAGMNVSESPTNRVISDVTGLDKSFKSGSADEYALVDAGVTIFKLKNRKDNKFCVVSAVTTSQETDDSGKKLNEIVTARTLLFVTKYMDVSNWPGVTRSITALSGIANQLKQNLIDEKIVQDLTITLEKSTSDEQVLNLDIAIKVQDVIKHIHKRVKNIVG